HRTGLAGPLWRLLGHSRRGHRTADGLSADLPGWRTAHGVVLRGQRLARMRMIERERERRLAGVGLLSRTRWAAPGVREAPVRPLLRVPLLVQRRDEVVARLARHGVLTGFLYDPPLGDYLPGLEPGPTPEVARHWCAHVLPVDPLRAATVIALLGAWGVIGAG
ncbi:MAG: hypothetical protein HOY71_18760, partial [Nonomuraea sp.]|nr:hypothetical protein [Nonomuraea sp.]